MIAVLTPPDGETAETACRALARGGLSCAEITFRTDAAAEAISRAARIEGFVVGAGTVLSAQQARVARDAGAAFAVAPGTNDDVVRACAELELPFVPGAATPTEIDHARDLGCNVVKLFPAGSLGGPGFVKAMSAVYPELQFVPTGGVDSTSLASYLALPVGPRVWRKLARRRPAAGRASLRRGRASGPGGGGARPMKLRREGRLPLGPGRARRGDAATRPR